MTESQSGSARDALSGNAGESGAPSNTGGEDTVTLPVRTFVSAWEKSVPVQDAKAPITAAPGPAAADPGRGSRRRSQWFSAPAGGTGNAADPGPSGPRRVQKKSALVLGGTVVLVIAVAAVVAVSLSGGGTTRIATAASSSQASPGVPNSGNLVPIGASASASKKAAASKKKAVSTHPSSPAAVSPTAAAVSPTAVAGTAPAGSSPVPESSGVAGKPLAPSESSASSAPAVVSVPEPVSWWPLNDDDPAETAQDSMGVNEATGTNIVWCGAAGGSGNCSTFNGTSSAFTTAHPVLDTAPGNSFTVSANVYMTALAPNSGFETIVSQDGTYDSGFYLQYSGADKRWAFSMVTADTDAGPPGIRALSTSAPELATWTNLVGVYDASDDQLRLYVNGVLEGTATDSSPFAATGDLAIGRGQFDGEPTDWFNGAANQIEVWNQALTTAQVDKI
jgi:Concanavalin A-like lectin/glucanases superfamily